MLELSKSCVITRVSNAAAAGTTAINTSVLDMDGFDGVCFVAELNTVVDGCILSLTAEENTANSTSGATAVANGGTGNITAATSSNKVLVSDVIRPSKRYVFATLGRTTQNATVDSILAIQYRAREVPVTQPASIIGSAFGGPEV